MRSRKRRAFRQSHTGLTRRSRIGRVFLSVAIALSTFIFSNPAQALVSNGNLTNGTTYAPTDAGTYVIPANVTQLYFVILGAAGGTGGTDGKDTTHSASGAVGKATGTLSVNAGDIIGIYPGFKGTDGPSGVGTSYNDAICGTTGTRTGDTAGGNSTIAGYNGGLGGRPGCVGSSGAGGGGGAASVLQKNSTTVAVAGGGGGGGGGCNSSSTCYDNGQDSHSTTGRPGTTVSTAASPYTVGGSSSTDGNGASGWYLTYDRCFSGANHTSQTADGGSGGGGGGGYAGGGSGGFYDARATRSGDTDECGGFGGYRGSNLNNLTNGNGSSVTQASTSNGSIQVYFVTASASSSTVTTT